MNYAFQLIVSQHAELFPQWKIDDLYKLVFQAAMGSEHAVADPKAVYDRLKSEADALPPKPENPLILPISPDHRLVRISLGPYVGLGGDLRALAQAFVQTAHSFRSSQERLVRYWGWVETMAADGEISFPVPLLKDYFDQRRDHGYPAVHHSPQFRQRYRPAYRVVLKELIALPMG